MPVGTSDLGVSPSRYLDPACTDEVLSRVTDHLGCPAPRGEASDFVAREEVAGGWRIYRVGERVGPLLNAYARDRDGVCRQGELVPSNVEYYRIGPYVRTVKPVPLTLVTDP